MYDLVSLFLPFQNTVGLIVNVIVLLLICNLAEGALQYVKTCLVISTVHCILFSLMNHLLVPTHHLTREGYFITLHGEFLPLLPSHLITCLLFTSFFLHSLTWTLQPFNFIVQYLVIAKKGGITSRIFIALIFLSFCLSIPHFLLYVIFFPSESESKLISEILQRSYTLDDLSFVSSSFVYGSTFENRKTCDYLISWLGFGSSFGLSYVIVLSFVWKLVRITRNDLLKDRKESVIAHWRVTRWLITQSLVPFIPIFSTISIILISFSLNLNLPFVSPSILISVLSTVSPIVQGLVNFIQITRWNCSNIDLKRPKRVKSGRRNTITQSSSTMF